MATTRGKIWMRYFVHKNALDIDIEDTIPATDASVRVMPWPETLNSPMTIHLRLFEEIHEAD